MRDIIEGSTKIKITRRQYVTQKHLLLKMSAVCPFEKLAPTYKSISFKSQKKNTIDIFPL
jgi:hypothetical protein